MARDAAEQLAPGKAYSVFVRLVLPPYAIHFKAPKYMKESTLDLLDRRVTKATLAATAQKATVRHAIGTDPKFWPELNGVLKVGLVSLERRSFAVWDPTGVDYESTSGALIAGNYPGLWKDLERVNDLLSIARNVLTIGASAQDLATAHQVELEVFKLINCAVRVTARGYDGEAGAGVAGDMSEEEKWQYIVNAYKKLLITSLQFLNNLVAQNEKRKLDLWMNLFDCGATSIDALMDAQDDPRDGQRKDVSNMDIPSNPTSEPIPPINGRDLRAVYGQVDEDILDSDPVSDPEGYIYFAKWNEQACAQEADAIAKSGSGLQLTAQNLIAERWSKLDKQGRESWRRKAEGVQEKYVADVKVYDAKRALQMQRQARRDAANAPDKSAEPRSPTLIDEEELYEVNSSGHRPIHAEDLKMHYTADAGIRILESGKAELMKRLEGYEPPQSAYSADPILAANRYREAHGIRPRVSRSIQPMPRARTVSRSPPAPMRSPAPVQPPAPQQNGAARNHADHGHVEELESEGSEHGSDEAVYGNGNAPPEEELEEDDEEEDADGEEGSNEDGRGLLTDVPLILGPSEIEVLPMIIMSGIVSPTKQLEQCRTEKERSDLANAHIVRTHLLLAQENGRNLLRELLIFVAAWDLREEELYFKFMVKIMEAVLQNGLMPFAYHAFRDRSRSRDIISPAQAVIMKLLTCIFRARGEAGKANAAGGAGQGHQFDPNGTDINASIRVPRHVPRRADLQILHFIFTEFRQHIIPQTCALIFLQGQIHRARALPSDFPLNLWDMERMYEGVYGVLEFFAVVCEEGWGKEVLAGWEAASELVTLVRELEEGIPKLGLQGTLSLGGADGFGSEALSRRRVSMPQRAASADGRLLSSHAQYLPDSNRFSVQDELNARAGILPPLPPPLQTHALQPSQSQIFEPTTPLAYPEDNAEADEPSDFEWRNLKKLTVLVLSSLIWKNRNVQTQVRLHGGLEALVGCCKHDEHNPYIREHAIMCLRFAVEGCPENRARLEELAQYSRGRGSEGLPRALLPGTPGTGGHSVSFSTYPDLHVPREVLDTNGYETFMDGKGQVGLRRKEPVQTSQAAQAIAKASTAVSKVRSSAAMTAEKAAELMQSALRDLPLGGDLVSERQKAEALAKLDRAFESTERVLGGVARGGKVPSSLQSNPLSSNTFFRTTPDMSTQVQDRQQSAQLAGLIRRQSTRCYKAIERRVSRRSATHTSTSRQSKALASDTHATFEVYRVELPEWIGRRKANPIHVSQHEGSIDSDDRQPETNEILSTTCSGSIELSTDSQHIGTEESDSPTRTQVDDTSSLPLAYDPQPVEGYTRAQLIDMPPHTPPTSAAYAWPDHPLLTMTRNYRELLRTHYKSQFEMELAYTVKGEAWPDYGACPERWQCNPHEFLLAHNMVYAHHYELDRVLQRQEDLIVTWAPHSLPFGGGGKVTEETAAEAYVHNGSLSCIQIINEADGRDYLIFRAERCKMMLAERRRRAVLAGHTVAPFGPCECKECKEMAERKKRMIEEMLDREEQAEKDARRCAPMAL